MLSEETTKMDYGILTEGREKTERELSAAEQKYEAEHETASYNNDDWLKNKIQVLRIASECYDRGISFLPADMNKSDPSLFLVENGSIRPPFNLPIRLSEEKCKLVCRERAIAPFESEEDLVSRCCLTKRELYDMQSNHALDSLNGANRKLFKSAKELADKIMQEQFFLSKDEKDDLVIPEK